MNPKKYPALVEKFCRVCGKRGEAIYFNRNLARAYYYCCEECKKVMTSRKVPLPNKRISPRVLKENVPIPEGFKVPTKFNKPEVKKSITMKENVVIRPIDTEYWEALRKHMGIRAYNIMY